MFSTASRRLLQTSRTALRRADPGAANTKMRTGPSYYAATAAIIGIGTGYYASSLAGEHGAKKEADIQTGLRKA
ncbi:hypothetical protein BDA99DRAFT_562039 [Phascolomyces articulosus]|uniref:Uncharacterized protein n=1 Tax=Phascolomyces articulosus TaxID=60185 RepID=A0AAD5K5U8_9FUNG|nr:hypothetical protein BDA99DRAFT_562039 [Phascolomyces articulosus]